MTGEEPMSSEEFRRSFYHGAHADMQFKFLAGMDDRAAADAVAEVLDRVGEALDTGDLTGVRDAVSAAQAAYRGDDTLVVDGARFTPLPAALPQLRLALISDGGVVRAADDPMGPTAPVSRTPWG